MKPRLLTADEVAEKLRVRKSWVYAATRANRIPHVRLGRYVRYRAEVIELWLDELECGQDDVRDRETEARSDGDWIAGPNSTQIRRSRSRPSGGMGASHA